MAWARIKQQWVPINSGLTFDLWAVACEFAFWSAGHFQLQQATYRPHSASDERNSSKKSFMEKQLNTTESAQKKLNGQKAAN